MKQQRIDTNHKRNNELINHYQSSKSLRQTAKHFAISFQRVSEIIKLYKSIRSETKDFIKLN